MESRNRVPGPLLDVRTQNPNKPDLEVKEIYAYGAGLQSPTAIVDLPKFTNLQSLSLHGNQIERIEGLEALHHLVTLNLSSNNIVWMGGISQLRSLRTLNLASNRVREIAGLHGLVALQSLILSHNGIALLGGLSALHGPQYALQHLDLRDNLVEYLCELWVLAGCVHLGDVVFQHGSHINPVCKANAYHSTLLSAVPCLHSLDGKLLEKHVTPWSPYVVSAPPLPIWALQHCYPAHQTSVNLSPFTCPPHSEAPRASMHPPRTPPKDQSQCHEPDLYPFQSNTKTKQKSSSKEHLRTLSQPRKMQSLQSFDVQTHDPHHSLQNMHHSNLANNTYPPTFPSHETQTDTQSPVNVTQRKCYLAEDMEMWGHPQQALRGSSHAVFETLDSQYKSERKNLQGELRQDTDYHEARLGRLEVRVLDLVGKLAKAKLDESKLACDGESRGQSIRSKLGDDDSSDPASENRGRTGSSNHRDRYVRFVDRKNKFAPHLQVEKDAIVNTLKESAAQTESVSEPLLERLCQEVSHLQLELANMTVKRDDTLSVKLVESSAKAENERRIFCAKLELDKKDTEIFKLIEDRKLLEDEVSSSKVLLAHERDHWQLEVEEKLSAITNLETKLKDCEAEVQKIRESAQHTERQLRAERSHAVANIRSRAEAKLSAMNSEVVPLKEALDFARNAHQTAEKMLRDATCENERTRQKLALSTTALDEQRLKLKIAEDELETCTRQEKNRREECGRLTAELDEVCKKLKEFENFKLEKEWEVKDKIERESVAWEACGRDKAEKEKDHMREELQTKLLQAQTELRLSLQDNAKTLLSMRKLRDDSQKEVSELKGLLESMREKERGAEELVTELTDIVRAQKTRLLKAQHNVDRLAASEQEVEHLRGEMNHLQEKSLEAEERTLEAEALRRELDNVSSMAKRERRSLEKAAQVKITILKEENEKFINEAAALMHKLHETEDIVRVKSKMLDSQNDTIWQLKSEIVEAKEVARGSISKAKVLEADWYHRIHEEVEQNRSLHLEVESQEAVISDLEMELKIVKGAKTAAENTCKSLQQKVNDVDSMLRYVEEEINRVKCLYGSREKTIVVERDDALEGLKSLQKKFEDTESAAAAAMRSQFETEKIMETQEKKATAALLERDIVIAELSRKLLEVEAEMHSRVLALERQKAISTAKVHKLWKVLEELREAT